jgi:hypothetical protein
MTIIDVLTAKMGSNHIETEMIQVHRAILLRIRTKRLTLNTLTNLINMCQDGFNILPSNLIGPCGTSLIRIYTHINIKLLAFISTLEFTITCLGRTFVTC